MELDILNIILYGFGSAITLLFIYISVLAGFFIKHIVDENNEESF